MLNGRARKHRAPPSALCNKYNSALNAHRGVIQVSAEPAEKFDYEVELVIVMGKTARNVREADALSYVFGYCIGNDFTARDLQSLTSQWMLGKTPDGFAPIGPYLVTADLVGDPNNLKLECRVNGEVRQSNNTNDMVFNCRSSSPGARSTSRSSRATSSSPAPRKASSPAIPRTSRSGSRRATS